MYSHLIKGFTLGQTLTRRLGRLLTGFPGFLLDALLVAPLYAAQSGRYTGFWDEATAIFYADGTLQRGFFQPLFGWVGDIVGAGLGAALGSLLGGILYVPDGVLRLMAWAHDQVHQGFDYLANLVGRHTRFSYYGAIYQPETYWDKAWNVSLSTSGVVLGAPLYLAAKAVEFVLPFCSPWLSNFFLKAGVVTGAVLGVLTATCLWPVKHFANKAVDLFRGFREGMRSLSAFIYARTDQRPAVQDPNRAVDDCNCWPDPVMHSPEFRAKVAAYRNLTTTEILFGALNVRAQQDVNRVGQQNEARVEERHVQAPGGVLFQEADYRNQVEGVPQQPRL